MTRDAKIDRLIDDIVSCADEADGGKADARAYCEQLVAALSTPAAPAPADLVSHDPPMGFCQWLDEGSDYTTECGHGWQFSEVPDER